MRKAVWIFSFILAPALLTAGCKDADLPDAETQEAYQTELFAMDTYMTFTAYGDNAQPALTDVADKIRELESRWSVTDEASEIYAVNHSRQGADVSRETAELVTFALDMAEKTRGALEPTIYPVLDAWGFTTEENRVPAEKEIRQLLKSVGHERVSVDENHIILEDGMMIDLGAVGKGYAGRIAAEILKGQGITSALLDIGGNIQTVGSKPDGSDWRLGIQSPFGEGSLGILEVSDKAVVTSGNYERYFIGDDGRRYGHIIDPSTGYPADNGLASVTVIAEDGRLCDALSTSLFVMGTEKAADYWQNHTGFEMILITEGGEIYLTDGADGRFSINTDSEAGVHIIQRET
ncbi:MAG: FAD:protein FMN transferase [Eubacterium sp.]|nr:FAD:protein FMN transferase [Eubacterium sp.]